MAVSNGLNPTFEGAVTATQLNTQHGGAVTQATSRSTGVTLNAAAGAITMNAASLAAGAEATFTVTNSYCTATSVPVVALASGETASTSMVAVTGVRAGAFDITVTNLNATTADTGAGVINFVVLGGANA